MKSKCLLGLFLFAPVFWSCTSLPKLAITPNTKFLFKDQFNEKLDTKLGGTNFACKKNFFWLSEGIIGFDGIFYDELTEKYSIGDPVLVGLDKSSNKMVVKSTDRQMIDSVAQLIGSMGYTKVGKVAVGATVARNVLRAVIDKSEMVNAEQREFEGVVYSMNRNHKISFEGFVVENSGTLNREVYHGDEVSKITIRFKRETDKDNITFTINKIPPFALNIENYWLFMQVSPDGNFIKFGQELLNLNTGKEVTIWGQKIPKTSNIGSEYVYPEGVHPIISPDWKSIGFIYVDYFLSNIGLGMKEIQKACKEAGLEFYSFKY